MDIGTASSWVAVGLTLIVTIYTWYSNTQRVTKDEVKDHSDRITVLESDVKSMPTRMPTKDAFHQLELAVAEVKGNIRAQEKELNAIFATLQRIEKWLLESTTPTTKRTR
jgi:hypothetical protein